MEASLPVEDRYLGDNSITEGFAFLFEHLTDDATWLERMLGVEEPEEVVAHSQAVKLIFVRRYCAKLVYELELQAENGPLDALPARYSELLGSAVRVDWPQDDLARRRRRLLLRRPLPARLGARDAPAHGVARPLRVRLVRGARRRRAAPRPMAARSGAVRRGAPGGARRRCATARRARYLSFASMAFRTDLRLALRRSWSRTLRSWAGVRSVSRLCTCAAVSSS